MLLIDTLAVVGILWGMASAVPYVLRSMGRSTDEHIYGRAKKNRIKTNWNVFGLVLNVYDSIVSIDWKTKLTPSTPLQKEIRYEKRWIKDLKQQKQDMERRDALRAEREALFEEAKEEEADYSVDPLPILRQQFSERQPIEYAIDPSKCPNCDTRGDSDIEVRDGYYKLICRNCNTEYLVRMKDEEVFMA